MSVDRGNTKLAGMQDALKRKSIREVIREGSVECLSSMSPESVVVQNRYVQTKLKLKNVLNCCIFLFIYFVL